MSSPNTAIAIHPLFHDLTDDNRQSLIASGKKRALKKGEQLFMHGENLRSFYLILDGAIRKFRETPEGKEITVELVVKGDMVGASHIFESFKTYQWSATAAENSTVLEYPIQWFKNAVKSNGTLAVNLLAAMSHQTHTATVEAEHLVTFSAAQRVACCPIGAIMSNAACITNKTYDEIKIGDSASLTRTLTKQDIQLFATVTGDMNPAHLDEAYAKTDIFRQIVGHGMWTGSLFSTLLGMYLPGPGTIYMGQTLKFLHPVKVGDTITASVHAIKKVDKHQQVTFTTLCTNEKGEHVLEGEAIVKAPSEHVNWKLAVLPEIEMKAPSHNYDRWLIDRARGLKPIKVAVVHPTDIYSLAGAVEAAQQGIIEPLFVGPESKIRAVAENAHIDLDSYPIISTLHSHAAAAKAVEMANHGKVDALMKGKLSTEELMQAVVDKETGLRTGRRMSHVFLLDVPSYRKPLILTDAAINIRPTLMEKRDIIQNAVDLFHTLGLGTPKVAILSASELVSEKLPSTLDATALCKMAERGQIAGAILDGPLAFDNAVSKESAEIKGIHSIVAGDADILVVPDIESGNMLYKQLRYFSGVNGAGIVLGAKVPIILTSRAGDTDSRVASSALASLYSHRSLP